MNIPGQRFNFDFMGKRKIAVVFSALLIGVSLLSLFTQKLNFGIDFTGGTLVEAGYGETVELDQVRHVLSATQFSDAVVQYFGSAQDILIRVAQVEGKNSADISNEIIDVLKQSGQSVEIRRVEFVGPQVGEDLQEDGGLAMIYALIMIFIYIAFRFQRLFSVGAIAALVHDVTITIGFFSVLQLDFESDRTGGAAGGHRLFSQRHHRRF